MAEAKLQAMESDLLDKQVTDSFAGENQRWQRAKTYRRNDGKARKDGPKKRQLCACFQGHQRGRRCRA